MCPARNKFVTKSSCDDVIPCGYCDFGFADLSQFGIKSVLEHMFKQHLFYPPFKCQICSKTYYSVGTYKVHKNRDHGLQLSREDEDVTNFCRCPLCGSRFSDYIGIYMHIVNFHGTTDVSKMMSEENLRRLTFFYYDNHRGIKPSPFCVYCGYKCSSLEPLLRHLNSEHFNTSYACKICKTSYPSPSRLVNHWNLKHRTQKKISVNDFEHECAICSVRRTGTSQYLQHLYYHHAEYKKDSSLKITQCKHCEATCESDDMLLTHYFYKHIKYRPFDCKDCCDTFSTLAQLHNHSQQNHGCDSVNLNENEGVYKCPICNNFQADSQLLLHHLDKQHADVLKGLPNSFVSHQIVAIFKDETDKIWDDSEKNFFRRSTRKKQKYAIKDSNQIGYGDKQADVVQCGFCSYESTDLSSFGVTDVLEHMYQEHLNYSAFYCKDCKRKFYTLPSYKCHVNKYHGVNIPIGEGDTTLFRRCPLCKTQFSELVDIFLHIVKQHGTTHAYEKVSENNLRRVADFKYNLHVHWRPVKCLYCTYAHKNLVILMRHINVQHYGINPYKCKLCKEKFSTPRRLVAHWNHCHPTEDGMKLHNFPYYCAVCKTKNPGISQYLQHVYYYHAEYRPRDVDLHVDYLQCKYCHSARQLTYEVLLGHYFHEHLKYKPFKCSDCPKSFGVVPLLDAHTRRQHGYSCYSLYPAKRIYKCPICKNYSSHAKPLIAHIDKVHCDFVIDMKTIDDTDVTEFVLESESRIETEQEATEIENICQICGKLFTDELLFTFHMRYYHR